MLPAAETWAVTVSTFNHLKRNDLAMIRWMRNVRANDNVYLDFLLSKLVTQNAEFVLHTRRMKWFGQAERSAGWISQMRKLELDSCKKPGKPKTLEVNLY